MTDNDFKAITKNQIKNLKPRVKHEVREAYQELVQLHDSLIARTVTEYQILNLIETNQRLESLLFRYSLLIKQLDDYDNKHKNDSGIELDNEESPEATDSDNDQIDIESYDYDDHDHID